MDILKGAIGDAQKSADEAIDRARTDAEQAIDYALSRLDGWTITFTGGMGSLTIRLNSPK